MSDRVQQARERADLYLAHGFIPRETHDMDVCADVLFLAERVLDLETALRKIANRHCHNAPRCAILPGGSWKCAACIAKDALDSCERDSA